MRAKRYWLRGALTGLFVPMALFGIFLLLVLMDFEFGRIPLTKMVVSAIAVLELPIVYIGRALELPIEVGGAAFLIYDFTVLGYVLMVAFWVVVGMFIGCLLDNIYYRE
ncbi:MAG: hypothetical protein PHH49_07915 [Candidatus Omnitrophica bacterium]|nr:hypothetical protein [Candidatus Omnitrophota bacterium]MDD5488863.1 hypothetical protein [Candidatus Omnitrophota bacterium]